MRVLRFKRHILVFQISERKRERRKYKERRRALSWNEQPYINSGFIKFIATP